MLTCMMSSKFGQIRSGTTEFATPESLKNQCCPFSRFTVVVIPGKKSGERLQDHWSSGFSHIFEIILFCFAVAMSDLVRNFEAIFHLP